jgi:hypothetical protein
MYANNMKNVLYFMVPFFVILLISATHEGVNQRYFMSVSCFGLNTFLYTLIVKTREEKSTAKLKNK